MYIEYLDKLFKTINKTEFLADDKVHLYEQGIEILIEMMSEVKRKEKTLFFIGNGGSSAIASHMTSDFMKNGGMKTYSLYDNAVTTCMGNDYGYEYVFSRPLEFLLSEGDLLVAISSSGNSENIVNAVKVAKEKGNKIITFSGFEDNNTIKSFGDFNVYVPLKHYGIVESIHNMILQQVVDEILDRDGVKL